VQGSNLIHVVPYISRARAVRISAIAIKTVLPFCFYDLFKLRQLPTLATLASQLFHHICLMWEK
jgi:hypothetical protein